MTEQEDKMADEPNISEEMKKMDYEPLSSAEKKFIVSNLVIGTVLLVVLVWVSHTYFPTTDMQAKAPAGQCGTACQPGAAGCPSAVPAANSAPGGK